MKESLKLNLGCGPITLLLVNVDGSNRAWLASRFSWLDQLLVALRVLAPTEFSAKTVYANLLRPFPWRDNVVEAIYMGEILEHFTQEDGEHVLRECYRVLKPGGLYAFVFRIAHISGKNTLRTTNLLSKNHRESGGV